MTLGENIMPERKTMGLATDRMAMLKRLARFNKSTKERYVPSRCLLGLPWHTAVVGGFMDGGFVSGVGEMHRQTASIH